MKNAFLPLRIILWPFIIVFGAKKRGKCTKTDIIILTDFPPYQFQNTQQISSTKGTKHENLSKSFRSGLLTRKH